MWKAAFTGRSESGGGSAAARPSKEEPRRKKSSHSNRAESVISSTSRRDDDKDRERRRREKSGSLYDNASSASRYENGSSYTSGGASQYVTAPSSRVGEPRPLTESALRMLPNDDEDDWEDEEKDARSEKKSKRRESGDEKRRKSTRSEKERSRSRSKERRDKKRENKSDKSRDKGKDRSRRDPELVSENSRAIPEMGSFAQFPGQVGPSSGQDAMMSGALPSSVPDQQFAPPTRADSWGAAAEYYLDEGQSVHHQPGVRPLTPNMLVNPDLDHLMTASAEANPVADTGHGSAAEFFSGKVSPVPYETPQKPTKPGKQSSSGKASKPSRTSSTGAAATALAAAGVGALSSSSHHHSSSQQQNTTLSSSFSSKPTRLQRQSSDGSAYYAPPSSNGTYPPTLQSTNGYGPGTPTHSGHPGKRPANSNSNTPLYAGAAAAAVAGAAGYAAYEHNQHSQQNGQYSASYNMASAGGSGGGGRGPPHSPHLGPGGYGYYPQGGSNGGMAQMPFHEHKGPMTRLKDGLLNLIASPEDTAKMEMYTEYIGVCKHCFDPRTSAWDAPRVHHYHKRRDSFEDLRRRRSFDKMRRRGSDESLRRKGSTRVDKENRYYASDSSRVKRESGGAGILGAGLAAAGAAGVANAMFSDRKDFDDTYSVKSGHRESSAVRRRSRSSSREHRRRSTYGVVRPDKDEYVTVRKKDGTIERRRVFRKSRSTSRDRKSSGLFGAAAAGAALGAAGMAASSRRHSRSPSPTVLGGADSRSRRRERRSPSGTSYHNNPRYDDRRQEPEGFFGGFFSPPQKKRRDSREHQKKRRGFFTFSNSSESSHDDLAFGEGFSSSTSLPLRRKSSTMSNRSGRNGRRISKKKSDEHIAATVAGIGATAAALAAAQRGHRINKRTSRPELGKRREPRYETNDSTDEEWEDELPSDVDDESSVDGGLAFGDYGGKRLSSRQSMDSIGSQSSAGGPLSAWGWRWGNKEQKRRGRRTSSPHHSRPASGSFVAPGLSAAGSVSGAPFDPSRPINKPVYLDDTGRPLPSISSASTSASGPQGPLQFVDPAPMSDAGSKAGSRHPSIPGAWDDEPPIIRPGPGPIQQPQPITPIQPSFTQSPPDMHSRPFQPRRSNSSPTRGHFAQDAAVIGAAALGTAGIIAGSSMASGRKSKDNSNVRFGLTEEQQRKDDRAQRKEQQLADEERRKADRTRALKEEAERAAKEARQEEIRQAREDENRRRAEVKLREQREADEKSERERQVQKEQARIERERLEREARDRREAAAAATAEVERIKLEREEAQRQADLRERERLEREEVYAREQRRVADERERHTREQESNERYERGRRDDGKRQSSASKWAPAVVGAAAAATVGAAIASEKDKHRRRREDSYYDEAHSGPPPTREYGTEEVKPKYEHQGEPIMDDDIFDPELFKRKYRDSSAPEELENDPRYVEFARRAADKIAADRERAYSPGKDKYATYADFFMPEELLNKTVEPGSKVRDVSPNADNEIAVWHARDDEIRKHFPQHASDYGYGRSNKHAPYGVPKLHVISPTPPLEKQSPTSTRGSKGSKQSSPLAKDADEDGVAAEPTRSQTSGKSERSRSISWGEDKTHYYYDIDTPTPEPKTERDSYITSPDLRSQAERVAAGVAGATAATAAGAALHDIIVEDPSGESHRYSEEEWRCAEDTQKSPRGRTVPEDDEDDVEDITPSPEPEPGYQGFYRQPFFDSVSDMGTGIFDVDSPGTEGAPPVRGFVEGEVDETPASEKAPRIPGGFDNDEDDPITAEIKKEQQTAQAEAGASKETEEPAWEPPLSKKEKKKRDKAAKRGSIAESDPPTPATETPISNGDAKDINIADAEYFPTLSKKDKKKLEKEAKKKGVGFADLVSQLQSDKEVAPEAIPEPRREEHVVEDWEPPLSKKEQKKRDKDAKKSGFADVADEILAAGGIAAAAAAATGMASAAMDSTEESTGGSGSSKKNKKSKKAKLGEPLERDPRDLESSVGTPPAVPEAPTFTEEPSVMPGAWDDDRRDPSDQSPSDTTVDPFQYQVRDPDTGAQERPEAKEVDSWAEWSEPATSKKSKKDKKKAKRGSAAFDTLPEISSPLRAEVPQDDYMGKIGNASNGTATYVNGTSSKNVDAEAEPTPYREEKPPDDRSERAADSFDSRDPVSGSSRQVSPDDGRSVVSAPEAGDRRKPKRDEARRGSDHTDEPSYAYETQSVAASEPADIYDRERKSSKRRSRHADDFDDTASVTSSRSKREKEESPSSSKKESKGGLFGLFSRKSVDEKSNKDGSQLSRKSTRDEEDESRRRRKHRSTSEYGDDDDDTRSVKSESRRKHRSHSEHGDEESRERRKRSSRDQSYDDYSRDHSSSARSEPASGNRHHHRRRTDDDGEDLSRKDSHESQDAVSESGHRHHRRRRTDDDYDSKDQSFLGNRVEDLPPLPASPDRSDSAAAQDPQVQREQGEGSPVSAESAHQDPVNDGKTDLPVTGERSIQPSEQPMLRTPGQSALSLETPQRPASLGRPVSSTAVPLRFPFGHVPPQTPASLKERAHSFSSTPGATTSSPISPASTTKQSRQGRPHSTEIRPLYLVERNRQTPEVDEALPSLPSSKPSSRSSSIHGSDENYQSAAEDWDGVESPTRRRALTVDIGEAQRHRDDGDVLGSQQTTPKASEFPQLPREKQHLRQEPQFYTWEDLAREGQTKGQPQFYTWEDFARDEKMHEQDARLGAEQGLPPLPRSRSVSPDKKDDNGHGSSFKSVAAAAMLGTAAVYAGHKLSERSPEHKERRSSHEPMEKEGASSYPLPAPIEASADATEEARPEISRKGSTKKKKGKKGKKSQQVDDEPEADAQEPLERQDTDTFFDAEAQAEAGATDPKPASEVVASAPTIHRTDTDTYWQKESEAEQGISHPEQSREAFATQAKENALDRFIHDEKDMEEGAFFASAAAHSMPVFPAPFDSADKVSEQQEEERPGTSYKIPEAKAEPAPLVVEERNVVVDHEQPTEIEPAPLLTRKQSKKAKKKQKAAALFTGEPSTEVADRQDDAKDVGEQTTDKVNEDAKAVDESRDIPTPTTAIADAPPINFGVPDFSQVAHQDISSWHDTQSQAFSDSMVKHSAAETPDVDASRDLISPFNPSDPTAEDDLGEASFEPVSKKKAKKDKKKKAPTWSEPDAEEGPSVEPESQREASGKGMTDEVAIGAAAATAIAAPALLDVFETAKSKKKAKKDKKKKPPTWSEPDVEIDSPSEPQPVDSAQAETDEAEGDLKPEQSFEVPSRVEDTKQEEEVVKEPSRPEESRFGLEASVENDEPADYQPVEEFTPSLSRKQSKKDKKKKKKSSAWDESVEESLSASRRVSLGDSAFAAEPEKLHDTPGHSDYKASVRHTVEPFPERSVEEEAEAVRELTDTAPVTGEIVPQEESAAKSALQEFATIGSKKNKKDKKKRNTFDWTEPESESTHRPDEGDPAFHERTSAEQSQGSPMSGSKTLDKDVQPAVEPVDDTIAVAEIVQPEETSAKSALEEFAPVPSKQSKKDRKKKLQSFDWNEPEPEVTSLPESRDPNETVQTQEPVWPKTLESQEDGIEASQDPTAATEAIETTTQVADEEFKPALSRKQSKKDKKKKKQQLLWEPESDAQPGATSSAEPAAFEDPSQGISSKVGDATAGDDRDIGMTTPEPSARDLIAETQEVKQDDPVQEVTMPDVPTVPEQKIEEPLEEFSWMSSTSKKSKKGKKGKKAAEPTPPPAEALPADKQPEAASEEISKPVETPQSWDDVVAEEQDGTQPAEEVQTSTPAPEPEQEPEFTWTSSSKKKGKKGKKSRQQSLADTSSIEKELPLEPRSDSRDVQLENETPANDVPIADNVEPEILAGDEKATETAQDNEGTAAEQQEDDWWSFPTSSKKSKEGKTSLEDLNVPTEANPQEESRVALGGDVQPRAMEASQADDDIWSMPISSKKKKKGKKSASGLPTVIAELVASDAALETPLAEENLATAERTEVAEAETDRLAPSGERDTGASDGGLATANEMGPSEPGLEASEEPANPTFDDIWAEEDIATVEDHDAVRDLMDESRDTTETSWTPSAKKGKKKRGKKGSIAEAKPDVAPVLDAEKDADVGIAPAFTEERTVEIGQANELQDQRIEDTRDSDAIKDSVETPTENVEPEGSTAEFWMPQSSNKKGKKGKKGKQLSWADEPSMSTEDKKDLSVEYVQDVIFAEPESMRKEADAQTLDQVKESETVADRTSQESQDVTIDDWLAPQAGKKKGKKGKKKQAAFDAFDEPETATPPESDETAVDKEVTTTDLPTDESKDAQDFTQTGATDAWEAPTKGKKGKKNKKAKQVFSWEDEPTSEDPSMRESSAPAQGHEATPVPESSWEEQENAIQETEADDQSKAITSEDPQMGSTGSLPGFSKMDVDSDQPAGVEYSETPRDWSKEIVEPMEVETKNEAASVPTEPESSGPAQQDEGFGFSIKKSKKDKKNAKKNRSSTSDPWAETAEASTPQSEDPEPERDTSHGQETAAIAATAMAAGADIAETTKTEPEDDEWAGFSSKKSKKAKKKARKNGSATPAYQQDDEPAEASTDVVDFGAKGPKPEASEQDDLGVATSTGLPAASAEEQRDLNKSAELSDPVVARHVSAENESGQAGIKEHNIPDTDRAGPWDEATSTSAPHHPSQDIDFTATVAAGLADSGFNPDMVINDPVFHRRASPPGAVAEADPEEGFSSTTIKRKKKKSRGSIESPVEGPAIPDEPIATDGLATDDFDRAISQGLQGTGFDPALLEKALASSNESSKDTTEPEEFSFATTKRKKGKKGKKAREDAESAEKVVSGESIENTQDHQYAAMTDAPKIDEQQIAESGQSREMPEPEKSRDVDILTVGRDEMDMDEMDRAYKAYKKNKRKQKKLKAASKAGGESTAEETEQSAMVSESEGLSRNTTMEDILGKPSTREGPSTQAIETTVEKPSAENGKAMESSKSPISPASVVQSAFPGLERVKRRVPAKAEPQAAPPEKRSPSPPRADPAFGTAGMAAVVAAAAREMKARKEFEKPRDAPRGEPSWSWAALDGEDRQEPESRAVGNKEHQPIRDSGYQESARSPQRNDRFSGEIPQILSTSSSRDSLRQRRSLEPLQIPTSPEKDWEIKVPKKRSKETETRSEEARSRTPSAETPLKPTSKDRASYLFQSPPEGVASTGKSPQPIDLTTSKQQTDNSEYFKTRSKPRDPSSQAAQEPPRDRSTFSPPPGGPLSPRQALTSIPEEQHVGKRNHAVSDVGGPEHIKAIKRAETPQDIRIREQAISPSMHPQVTIPSGSMRSASNPLSTDELIKRLSWPSVDEQADTVNLDRHLGHRHSRPALPDPRSPSAMSNRSNTSGAHFKSPQELRSYSRNSNRSQASSTHSLRRVSLSGDLRAAAGRRGDAASSVSGGARASPITIPFEPPPTPPLNDDDVIDASASRAADMNDDVFGYGDAQGSQVSPTRPPSVRKRQSMHINDLESRVDQLVAENRALQDARSYAEQTNGAARDVNGQALQEALMERDLQIQEKDAEINKIKAMLLPLQEEVARLVEINGGLTEANRNLVDDTNGRYATLQQEHSDAHQKWQSTSRELDTMRQEHGRITSGMKDIVEAEIATALADKNAEILRLREQLDIAAEQIRALQVQIQSSKTSDFLIQRDEDYFDGSCQKLCQHVQQWVLRFSKLSDNRVCRLSTELNDDKIEARLDNAVLDGSDVDKLLGDRVRRRDVFMSVVMTMVWEYVFTRYLFGMDREQRQKLKALEKLLAEVGPPRAVAHWRATTLTLLSKRPSFESQCALDTEAVAHEIFGVLCRLLPPPSNAEQQLLASLSKVIRIAVDLSIEMRTQRAEYIMLPPLQPEYDTNGDLVRKVHFNASLMNERSGFFSSNEELAAEQAVVKIVLFPLVVKKGDEVGEGEEEIVVCPAQVLVQNDGGRGKKVVRVMSGAMEIDDPIRSRQSRHSLVSEAPGSVQF